MQKKKVPKKILHTIIERIVEVAHPERIIMFGSAARGEMGPHSDIDLLVIKKGVRNSRDIAAKIYMRLYGVGKAVDIIVVSPEQVEKYRDSPYLVIYPATRDGVVIYDANIFKRAGPAQIPATRTPRS
jgi:predicted nucleotidyltransferase